MENETKQTKAYSYFVYFLYMQLAHFPHTLIPITSKQICLQFACNSAWLKCAENARNVVKNSLLSTSTISSKLGWYQ